MADRDAFGRDHDDDPLATLGWQQAPSGARPLPAGEPARPPRRRRSRRAPGVTSRAIGVVAIALAAGVALLATSSPEQSSVAPLPQPEAPAPAQPPAARAPTTPPKGVDRGSLILRTNFAPAMRRLRDAGLGRLSHLRVAPDRIDAQLVTSAGRIRLVQVRPGAALRTISTSGAGFGHLQTVPFAAINSAAPFRMVSRAAARMRRNARAVAYLALTTIAGHAGWAVYFNDQRYFVGDARGRIIRGFP